MNSVQFSAGIGLEATTNAEGVFPISNAPVGAYTVTITVARFGNDLVTHHICAMACITENETHDRSCDFWRYL
jgi:hypothetical protein